MKNIKHIIAVIIAFALVVTSSFVAVTDTAEAATPTYRLSRTSVILVKGQKIDLFLYGTDKASMNKINEYADMPWISSVTEGARSMSCAKYKGLPWKSSKSKVATVNKNGTVTAKKAGKAKIKVKYNGKTYTCNVKVYKSLSKKKREKLAKKEAKRIVKTYTNSKMNKMRKAQILAYYMVSNVGLQEDQGTKSYKKNYGNEAYSALIMHISACSGYCKAYKMLCQEAGIKCKHINANKWTHQWNAVYIGGKWLEVDTQGGWFELKEDDTLMAKTFDKTHMGPIYRKTRTFKQAGETIKLYM